MKVLLMVALLWSGTAMAQREFGPGDKVVQEMTCAEAQAFATKNKFYWTDAKFDILPIYPIQALKDLKCPTKRHPAPQWEHTLDNKYCVLSWFCKKMGGR